MPAKLATDLAHGVEFPDGILPATDFPCDSRCVTRRRRSPQVSNAVKHRGARVGCRDRLPEQSQILRRQAEVARDGVDRGDLDRLPCFQLERGTDILLHRQEAVGADVQRDSLFDSRLGRTGLGLERPREAGVERLQSIERLVCKVATGVAGGEANAIGQEHGMGRNALGGVEILGDEAL